MDVNYKKANVLERPYAFSELLGKRFVPLDFFPEDIVSYSERKGKQNINFPLLENAKYKVCFRIYYILKDYKSIWHKELRNISLLSSEFLA